MINALPTASIGSRHLIPSPELHLLANQMVRCKLIGAVLLMVGYHDFEFSCIEPPSARFAGI